MNSSIVASNHDPFDVAMDLLLQFALLRIYRSAYPALLAADSISWSHYFEST
jgi:hypothetical protein